MSYKNLSSFGLCFRRLGSLSSNHTTGVHQLLAFFISDQVSSVQFSNNWRREKRGDRGDSHTLGHTNDPALGVGKTQK